MIRGLVFDFDGLILETEGPIYQSWQELYTKFGFELPFDLWQITIGLPEGAHDPLEWLEEKLGYPLDRVTLLPMRRQREIELVNHQAVLPGVSEYLQQSRQLGLKVGLASSSTCEWVTGHLTRLGLIDYFDCLKAVDDVARAKPDPELYRDVITGLSIQPKEAIAFEDSPIGILAAKRAGLYCVAVPTEMTRCLDFSQADMRLDSLAQMPLALLLAYFSNEIVGLS